MLQTKVRKAVFLFGSSDGIARAVRKLERKIRNNVILFDVRRDKAIQPTLALIARFIDTHSSYGDDRIALSTRYAAVNSDFYFFPCK